MTGRIAVVWICLCGFAFAQSEHVESTREPGKVSIRLKLSRQNESALGNVEVRESAQTTSSNATSSNATSSKASVEAKSAISKPGIPKLGIPKLGVVTAVDVTRCLFEDEAGVSSRKAPEKLPPDPTSLLLQPSYVAGDTKQPSKELPSDVAETETKSSVDVENKAVTQGTQSVDAKPESGNPESGNAEAEVRVEIANKLRLDGPLAVVVEGVDAGPLQLKEDTSEKAECPGSPEGEIADQPSQPDDVENAQDEHPYDAPAAKSTGVAEQTKRLSRHTREEVELQIGINECLNYFMTHPENVARRGPWALMHAAIPFGVEAEVIAGNRRVNALGWMCYNGVCAKQRLFQPTKTGFRANVGAGVQGHEGQFLAILAQSRVPADYPIVIGNRRYTVADLVKYEMVTCREKSELTFKLIGLSHYLPANQRWRDNRGHTWNLEKMVAEELAQPVVGAACGGTHRLMGLSYAVVTRQRAGLPIDGNWQRAEIFLNDYVNYAMSLQNSDGSFSTSWFEGRGRELDVERQVQTTGHILEWLIYTLPDEYLRSPRIQNSVQFLIDSVGKDPSHDWPIGPRGHALRALALYNQRVFGAEVGNMRASIAGAERTQLRR